MENIYQLLPDALRVGNQLTPSVQESLGEWKFPPYFGGQPVHFYAMPIHVEAAISTEGILPAIQIVTNEFRSTLAFHGELLRQILTELRGNALSIDPADAAANTASAQLREAVTIIQEGRTLAVPTPEIDALLERAIERKRNPPANIEEWARQLSISVGHLTD